MKIKAYAKINQILKVVEVNEKQYHFLQMISSPIQLYDLIEIKKSKQDELHFKKTTMLTDKDDFVKKFFCDFKEKYHINKSYCITITKNIPIGSGLGGESTDCACLVLFLIKKYKLKISQEELNSFCMQYGADIPFFLYHTSAYVSSLGEKILPIQLPSKKVAIVYPNQALSTKEVFSMVKEKSTCTTCEELVEKVINEIHENDLEEPAFLLNGNLKKIKGQASEIGIPCMSGSGSSIVIYQYKSKKEVLNYFSQYQIIFTKTR